MRSLIRIASFSALSLPLLFAACAGGEVDGVDTTQPSAGAAGSSAGGASAGKGGAAGTAGKAGGAGAGAGGAGNAGSAGTSGSSGASGSAGKGGAAGNGGASGAGQGGTAGNAGASGKGGSAGATGGSGGASGKGGSAGATGGSAGATGGASGKGGSAGATGGSAGATGGSAGATGGSAGATGGSAGATGGSAGATGGSAGATGGSAGATGGSAGATGGAGGDAGAAGASGSGGGSACDDGAKNGSETGVDCGGPDCKACDIGGGCATANDCTSRLCAGATCGSPSTVPLVSGDGGGGEGVTLDETYVYWTIRGSGGTGRILRAKLDGTDPEIIASNLANPTTVTTDATTIYFSSYGEGVASYLSSMPKSLATGPTKLLDLAAFSYGVHFDADDGYLYYTEHVGGNLSMGSIGRLNLGTQAIEPVATGQPGRLYALAHRGTTLYAASVDANALYSYDLTSLPTEPTGNKVIGLVFGYPINVAVDDAWVYVQDANTPVIRRVSLDGLTTDTPLTCGSGTAGGVAVSAGAVYFTCGDGLHIEAKPL